MSNYTFGTPTTDIPEKTVNLHSTTYAEIWDEIEKTDSSVYLPVIWKNWSDAFKFAQACKSKRIGKPGRPNFYADIDYFQRDTVVFVKGRA